MRWSTSIPWSRCRSMTSRRRNEADASMRRGYRYPLAQVGTLAIVLLLWAPPSWAQPWQDLSPRERYNLLRNYRQHEQLPQERRQEIEKRYERWQGMSDDEREKIRQNYQRFQQLPPQERERFHQRYQKWRQQGEPS